MLVTCNDENDLKIFMIYTINLILWAVSYNVAYAYVIRHSCLEFEDVAEFAFIAISVNWILSFLHLWSWSLY